MLGAEYTSDYIGDSIVTYDASRPFVIPNSTNVLQQGQRYARYANIGNSWSVRAGLSYGLPVKFLGSNLNFNVGATFAQTPNIVDGARFMRSENYFDGGVQLSSNISENIDFTILYNGSYNIASGISNGVRTDDRFVNQYASASIKWVIWKGITFTGNASYTQYKGITNKYDEQYVLCNLLYRQESFPQSAWRDKHRGERPVQPEYEFPPYGAELVHPEQYQPRDWQVHIPLQFVYNLRNFGKKATRAASQYDNFDTGGSGSVGVQRPGGMPGPGGPPPHVR